MAKLLVLCLCDLILPGCQTSSFFFLQGQQLNKGISTYWLSLLRSFASNWSSTYRVTDFSFLLHFWINFKFYLLSFLIPGPQLTLIDQPTLRPFSQTSLQNPTVHPTISSYLTEVKKRLVPITNLLLPHSSRSHKWEHSPLGIQAKACSYCWLLSISLLHIGSFCKSYYHILQNIQTFSSSYQCPCFIHFLLQKTDLHRLGIL